MTYLTGTINDANPGAALYTAIESPMISLGYQLVDTVIIGAITHKVMKSPAATNVMNLSWYMDISYPTTGTANGFRIICFEDYNATTHLAFRGPYGTSDTVIENTYYTRYGATGFALQTNWSTVPSWTQMGVPLTTGTFTYFISVTMNRIIHMLSNNAANVGYCGFYKPTNDVITYHGTALFPLVCGYFTSAAQGSTLEGFNATAGYCFLTRAPKATSFNWNQSGGIATTTPLTSGQVGSGPSQFNGRIDLAPIIVWIGHTAATYAATTYLGQLDGLAFGKTSVSTVRGDNVAIGADLWYATSPNGVLSYFMQGI